MQRFIVVVTARLLISEKCSVLHFFTRASEHMGTSNLTGKHIKNTKGSVISDHLLQCDCPITFDDFGILESNSSKFKLLIKEFLPIKCAKAG